MDIALAEGPDGKMLVHRVDCPLVRAMAARGEMVATLFGIQGALPDDLEKHSCLKEKSDG